MLETNVDQKSFKFKIVLLGEGCVGKSSLVLRFVENKFSCKHLSTIQASFQNKTVNVEDCQADLHIWDTAGQEKYHALGPIYYRGSNGVLLVFDITDRKSFEKVKNWVLEIKTCLGNTAEILIVGNKIDLEEERQVTRQDAEAYAESEGALYMETSAQDNVGISDAFESLTAKMIEHSRTRSTEPPSTNRSIRLIDNDEAERSKKCCR
ncbi:Ras-related protein Rab-21 [Caenorhabditis elegans]|uniref:Ras-related protein Rab-21 n=2 Tax=Caenorhabditis elegans TaxID=6239 RepID=Q22045_CAEEL|nr:Ras-related protein Rab-21 [Caenorhabditis elegans]CAA91296.1 Ras-related protein Rab-21 [Caenorhabditis elegans]|eukprot:NP_495854.1 RAB family [Caenorhabditis elegans]